MKKPIYTVVNAIEPKTSIPDLKTSYCKNSNTGCWLIYASAINPTKTKIRKQSNAIAKTTNFFSFFDNTLVSEL